jgi:NAD(P)-dependent dehydrogenase (short-subunit alcohol dehydrogenase family)
MDLGAGNPWGVNCSEDGRRVYVAHAGSEELTVLDAATLLDTHPRPYLSPLVAGVSLHSGDPDGPRRRIALPGKGPRAVAVAGSHVIVAEYFSDSLAMLEFGTGGGSGTRRDVQIRSVRLAAEQPLRARRRGEYLFQTAKICYQQWQSCASCHPDGRAEGLNWDLMNDGFGTFKNTKSMLLSHATPPAMSEGVRPSAEAAVRSGLTHILFTERPEEDAAAIDTYLRSLEPVPSPYLVDGQLSPAAERGKRLFESDHVGCARCHPAPLYTDQRLHDVGTAAYGASKAAIVEMTKVLAKELAPVGITCNVVAPSVFPTESITQMGAETAQKTLESLTIPRELTIEEIANVVSFFAAPESRAVTGQVVHLGLVS